MNKIKEPKKEDVVELDMDKYCLPGLGNPQTELVFSYLKRLCRYMYKFFEANDDGKDFVYNQKNEATGEIFTVTISRSSPETESSQSSG